MTTASKLPPIIITDHDHDRLHQLSLAHEQGMPLVAAFLQNELSRARVVSRRRLPPTTVTMNSVFEFRNEDTGKERRITLVYPCDADIDRNRVSVMTPVGAAMIGLSEGQAISWDKGYVPRRFSVTRMIVQPEAEGLDPDVPPVE